MKIRLFWNLTQFVWVTRFHETNPTVRSVSSSDIEKISKLSTCNIAAIYCFAIFLEKIRFFPGFTRILLSFATFEHTPYVKYHLPRTHRSPRHFVWHPSTWLSLNSTLIPLVGKPYGPFLIHFGMISPTLGLRPHGFIFGLFLQNVSY